MKAADLRLGQGRKYFEGKVSVEIKAGTPIVIRRIPDSDTYQLTILDDRKPNASSENLSAFVPDWILRGVDEPPPEQKQLFDQAIEKR
jgi:hypothetical protein